MIGLDTNVLVRYITQDDQQQSKKANKFIETQLTKDEPGIISKIVLCELAWVLSKSYAYPKQKIAEVIQQILVTQEFLIEDSENAFKALQSYQNKSAGFADCFLAQTHQRMGAEYTVSFDKKALKSKLFRQV
ncbi:MAG: type II toxin-antitoxin system VapC family toxin [Cocleimonas sp.]|nr:type II toxin-antitoxin system VapC family toxin [Cocleimonas sp.]